MKICRGDLLAPITSETAALAIEIRRYLADDRRGEILRDGLSVALIGPPNSGKSSLLNALAGREAAIVSAVAGTTRDVIEVHMDLGGYPVVLADTAGIRDSSDEIEQEGGQAGRGAGERGRILFWPSGTHQILFHVKQCCQEIFHPAQS